MLLPAADLPCRAFTRLFTRRPCRKTALPFPHQQDASAWFELAEKWERPSESCFSDGL